MNKKISLPSLKRLPKYYGIVSEFYKEGREYIRSVEIAKKLDIDETQVRKDIAMLNYAGKPKVGFNTFELKATLESYLDLNNLKDSFIIGTGNLGLAIAKYNGFEKYGLNITALFDTDPLKIGLKVGEKEIFHVSKFPDLARRMQVKIIIIAVPKEEAQKMADLAVNAGVKAVWNFAPANIVVPKDVLVVNQDLAADYMVLCLQLSNLDKAG